MSENLSLKNEDLLKLLLSLIPQDSESLKERAFLLASFDNLKRAIEEMESYLVQERAIGAILPEDEEFLEKMKKHLN